MTIYWHGKARLFFFFLLTFFFVFSGKTLQRYCFYFISRCRKVTFLPSTSNNMPYFCWRPKEPMPYHLVGHWKRLPIRSELLKEERIVTVKRCNPFCCVIADEGAWCRSTALYRVINGVKEGKIRANIPHLDSSRSLIIRFTFAANIVIAPCICMASIPYDSARAYPKTFFNSAFFASILNPSSLVLLCVLPYAQPDTHTFLRPCYIPIVLFLTFDLCW